MILIIHAHPYPQRSRVCRTMLAAVGDLPGVEVRSLYDLYPDFDIDVIAEQAALRRADLIVWLHPIYWYSVPGMLKHWFDVVLLRHWAYGEGGNALHGKHCLWVTSTGGQESSFSETGAHRRTFAEFIAPVEQTARFCGMHWEEPIITHGAHLISDDELGAAALAFKHRLSTWQPSAAPTENQKDSDAD